MKPGASRTRVGGRFGVDSLVVAVQAPAVDGRATSAALAALAKVLGCPTGSMLLVRGATSRTKTVEVPDECGEAVRKLLDSGKGD